MESFTADDLQIAARNGDVEYLIQALNTKPIEFFLDTHVKSTRIKKDEEPCNFIQNAIVWEQLEFIREALQRLPPWALQQLLCHKNPKLFNVNAFHCAAVRGNPQIAKLLLNFYKSLPCCSSSLSSSSSEIHSSSKPWLEVDTNGLTPFHLALRERKEECALELLSIDAELLCNMVDNQGSSPLTRAIRLGCGRVAMKILTSGHSYSTAGASTGWGSWGPLDAAPNCCEEVCRLLLEKHPEMITDVDEVGYNLLHKWIKTGKLWPFQLLFAKEYTSTWSRDFIDLMSSTDKYNDEVPLHQAAFSQGLETLQVVKFLVEAYQDACKKEKGVVVRMSPWKRENHQHKTPLELALTKRREDIVLYLLSVDLENSIAKGALFDAVKHGCDQVVENILTSIHESFLTIDDRNLLHVAHKCTERIGALLVERLPWQINEVDANGRRPLDIASENGTVWLIRSLLKRDPSSIISAPSAWIEACKRGHLAAIHAFIDHCPDFRMLCIELQDTPLHHIKLKSYKEYQDFLMIPLIGMMKNATDSDGATPLHRAVARKDIYFVEVLLITDGLDWSIKDKYDKSAMDLLRELCDQSHEWDAMCERIRVNPRLRTKYFEPNRINMGGGNVAVGTGILVGEMRKTLSVVAALLATLTFAAGFTIPGGFDEDTGEAVLATKASFLVFILADTYAMCCSMLVLFCLMWSMVCDRDRSLLLIDRGVLILKQSLYGTLLALMTGVFSVISQKSFWASIFVIVMCSLVAISANKKILFRLLDKSLPSTKIDTAQASSVQERTPLTSATEEDFRNGDAVAVTVLNVDRMSEFMNSDSSDDDDDPSKIVLTFDNLSDLMNLGIRESANGFEIYSN